jgi:hypothetical protein
MYSLSMRDTGWNDVAVRRTLMMVVASSAPDRGGDDGMGAARKRGLGLRRLLARLTGQAGGAAVLQGNGVIAAVQNDPQAGPSRASPPLSASSSSSMVRPRRSQPLTVDALPTKVLAQVLVWLPPLSLLAAGGVCRRWRLLVMEDELWRRHVPPEWASNGGDDGDGESPSHGARARLLASPEWQHWRWTGARLQRALRHTLLGASGGRRRSTLASLFGARDARGMQVHLQGPLPSHCSGEEHDHLTAMVQQARRRSSSSAAASESPVTRGHNTPVMPPVDSDATPRDRERVLVRLHDTLQVVRFRDCTTDDAVDAARGCDEPEEDGKMLATGSHDVLQAMVDSDDDGYDVGMSTVLPGDAAAVMRLRRDPRAYCGRRVEVVVYLGADSDVLLYAHTTKNVPGFRERMYARHRLVVRDDYVLGWQRRRRRGSVDSHSSQASSNTTSSTSSDAASASTVTAARQRWHILKVEDGPSGATWYCHTAVLAQLQVAAGLACLDLAAVLRLCLLVVGIRVTGALEGALRELLVSDPVLAAATRHADAATSGISVPPQALFQADPLLGRLPTLGHP